MKRAYLEKNSLSGADANVGARDGLLVSEHRHPTVAHLRDLVSNVIYFIFQYALHAEVAGNDQFVLGHQYSPYIGDVSCFVSNHHNCAGAFAQERGSRKAGSLHKLCYDLPVAVTEALEGTVRA